jgi:hypothetical protein
MNKIIRDGKVAVLYSPGFGAGWYSWNSQYPECLFDPEIVVAVENGDLNKVSDLAIEKWENFYTGGSDDLKIEWLPEGTAFRIDEYDGSESIITSVCLDLIA